MEQFLWFSMTGLMEGGIYALVALAFVLIYKATGIVNFAQGEFVLILAFVCWSFLWQLNFPIWLGFLATGVVAFGFGYLVQRIFLNPLIGQSMLAIVMITIALSTLLRGFTNLAWGSTWQRYPEFIPVTGVQLGPVNLSLQHIICFSVSLVLFLVFVLFFRYTRMGLGMRAVAEGHQAAQGAGIDIKWTFGMVWAISAIASAVGGVLLGSINGINVPLADIGLKALPAALLGGMDSIAGALVGGLIIGLLEGLAVGYLDPVLGGGLKDAFPYVIMIIVLLVRPYGIFGLKRIERV